MYKILIVFILGLTVSGCVTTGTNKGIKHERFYKGEYRE